MSLVGFLKEILLHIDIEQAGIRHIVVHSLNTSLPEILARILIQVVELDRTSVRITKTPKDSHAEPRGCEGKVGSSFPSGGTASGWQRTRLCCAIRKVDSRSSALTGGNIRAIAKLSLLPPRDLDECLDTALRKVGPVYGLGYPDRGGPLSCSANIWSIEDAMTRNRLFQNNRYRNIMGVFSSS